MVLNDAEFCRLVVLSQPCDIESSIAHVFFNKKKSAGPRIIHIAPPSHGVALSALLTLSPRGGAAGWRVQPVISTMYGVLLTIEKCALGKRTTEARL